MPDYTTQQTDALVDLLESSGTLNGTQQAIMAEIKARKIKNGDDDDDQNQTGEWKRRGGIRPYHAPTII